MNSRSLIVLAWILGVGLSAAQLDTNSVAHSAGAAPVLRWDNVESGWPRLGGERPLHCCLSHRHVFRLDAGERVWIFLPAGENLRLVAAGHGTNTTWPRVHFSTGSGLQVQQAGLPVHQRDEVVFPNLNTHPVVAWISAKSLGVFAAFVSRHETLGDPAPFRHWVAPTEADDGVDVRRLERWDRTDELRHVFLPAGSNVAFRVEGPTAVKLTGRVSFPPTEAGWNRVWRLHARFSDGESRTFSRAATIDLDSPFFDRGTVRILGHPHAIHLRVPEGEQELRLRSSADLYLRVLRRAEPDLLLPRLNRPPAPDAEAAGVAVGLNALIREADVLWRDNTRPHGGLLAHRMLLESARQHPTQPDYQRAMIRRRGVTTFFDELLPSSPVAEAFPAVFPDLQVMAPASRQEVLAAHPAQLPELTRRMNRGSFSRVPADAARALNYELPPLPCATDLRLAISADRPVRLFAVINEAPPRELEWRPFPAEHGELERLRYRITGGMFARAGANLIPHQPMPAAALPGPVIPAGHWIFPGVPGGARLRVYTDDPAARVFACVHYRKARPFSLGETDYRERLEQRGRASARREFLALLRDPSTAHTELEQHWLPLIRLLRSRAEVFGRGVTPPPPAPDGAAAAEIVARWTQDARQAEREGRWLDALEDWTRIVRNGAPVARGRAELARLRVLRKLGEPWLANQQARGLMLHGNDPVLAAAALEFLLRHETNPFRRESALMAAAVADPSSANLAAVVGSLAQNHPPEFALTLNALLPANATSTEDILSLSLNAGWWRTFERNLARLDSDERREHWLTQRHRAWGGTDALDSSTEEIRWTAARQLVTAHAGVRRILATERSLDFDAFMTTPDEPARLTVRGPGTLRLQLRPLHAAAESALDGSWEWRHGPETVRRHYLGNRPSETLRVHNDPRLAGEMLEHFVRLRPGTNEIVIRPDVHPLVFRVHLARGLAQHDAEALRQALPATPDESLSLPVLAATKPGAREAQLQDLAHQAGRTTDPDERLRLAVAATEVLGDGPRNLSEAALRDRIMAGRRWVPFESIVQSPGVRQVPVVGWQPESIRQRVRKSLLAPLAANEELLFGHNRLALSVRALQPLRLLAEARLETPRFLPAAPVELLWEVGATNRGSIPLAPGAETGRLEIGLPAGEHVVYLRLAPNYPNHYLRLKFTEQQGLSRRPLAPEIERSHHVLDPGQSLRLRVAGPTLLRVQRRTATRHDVRLLAVTNDWHDLVIAAKPGDAETLVRVHELSFREPSPPAATAPARRSPALAEPAQYLAAPSRPAWVELHDEYSLGGQEDGTWTAGLGWVRRNRFLEDDGGSLEEFAEFSLTHRFYRAERNTYTWQQLLYRRRRAGGPTLGGRLGIQRDLAWPGWTWRLTGEGYAQDPNDHGAFPLAGSDWNGSARLGAAVSRREELTARTAHITTLSGFARYLSLDRQGGIPARRLDQDVFTPYKHDHQFGLTLSETLIHRPWRDTIWHAGASVTANEAVLTTPDRFGLRVGWDQLIGPARAELAYRHSLFLNDRDRNGGADRGVLTLGLRGNLTRFWTHRAELGARYRYDLRDDAHLVTFALRWHWGRGRGLRDFRPGEEPFRTLRHWRLREYEENRLAQ